MLRGFMPGSCSGLGECVSQQAVGNVSFTRRMRSISAGAYYRLVQYLRNTGGEVVVLHRRQSDARRGGW